MKHNKTYKHPQLVVVVIASHNPLLLGNVTIGNRTDAHTGYYVSGVNITGSQGGVGKTGVGNYLGGSGGHGGGFKAVDPLPNQTQTYAGCGGSSWGDTTKGQGYTTTAGGATAGGDGKVIITWYGTTHP